jgi:hypothetical protein
MSQINTDQPVWRQIVDAVKTYPYGCDRLTIADRFSISKSTAKEHLEKAVDRKELRKFYGWISKNYRGWIYINPADAPNPMYTEVLDELEWKSEAFQDRTVDYDRGTPYAIPINDESQVDPLDQHLLYNGELVQVTYDDDDLPF